MANAARTPSDDALDECRHGRGPSQFCAMCDRAEVGFEPGRAWPKAIDLRDERAWTFMRRFEGHEPAR